MHFKSIELHEWRQFMHVKIDFHPNLTVLTGPNGSGKSTILSLLDLSINTDRQEPFLATPVNDAMSGKSSFSLGTLFARLNPFKKGYPQHLDHEYHDIGTISYADGERAGLLVDAHHSLQYTVTLIHKRHIDGFKIESHRALPRYQQVDSLPVSGITPNEAFLYFAGSQREYQRGSSFRRSNGRSVSNPVAPLKETLIAFAAFGADNSHMKAVPELIGLFDGFQDILRTVLPREIGFIKLEVRSPEIVVVSQTGEFPIDAASGGLMSLIQTAWQIFLFTKARGSQVVVLIDEPENHLHPSLQRDFLSNLVKSFSDAQFIVATHSPFIISSVKDSNIYALKYSNLFDTEISASSAVTALKVDMSSKAGSASKILDEVLGVSVTIPVWAETELNKIADQFEKSDLSENSIKKLRDDLGNAGLSEFFPEAIGRILND